MKELNQYILEKFKISKNIKNEITLEDIEEVIDKYFKDNYPNENYYKNIYNNETFKPAVNIKDIDFISIQLTKKDENMVNKVSNDLFEIINNIYPLKDEIDISHSKTMIYYYPKK